MTRNPIAPAFLVILFAAMPALAQEGTSAVATFLNIDGVEVGSVSLTQTADGVAISGEIIGMPPGEHGFHLHQVGDCDATTAFESAGDHFEPGTRQHGLQNPDGPHAGDLPNQTAGQDGSLAIAVASASFTLDDGEADAFDDDGSALVLHAQPDDNVTQPSGNSGDRIACAVIEAAPAQ